MISKTHLPNQKEFENIKFLLRRHWIVPLEHIILFIFLAAIPLGLYWILNNILPSWLTGELSRPIITLMASIYFLFIWLLFFHNFIDYYLDVWIVSNDRIINIEQQGLFSRTISEQKLYRVQDVTSEVKGILPTLLHYGNVYVQTAGEKQRFIFRQIPRAHEISKKIIDLAEEDKKYHQEELKQALGAVLGK